MTTDTTSANRGHWEEYFSTDTGIAVEGWLAWDTTNLSSGWIQFAIINSEGNGYGGSYDSEGDVIISKWSGYPSSVSRSNLASATAYVTHAWHKFRFIYKPDGYMRFEYLGVTVEATDTTYSGDWKLMVWSGVGNHKYEELRVRRYVDPEPTVSVGPEILL